MRPHRVVALAYDGLSPFEFGIVVDQVSEVVTAPADSLAPIPDVGALADAGHILGFVSVADRLVVMLHVDRLIDGALHLQTTQEEFAHD